MCTLLLQQFLAHTDRHTRKGEKDNISDHRFGSRLGALSGQCTCLEFMFFFSGCLAQAIIGRNAMNTIFLMIHVSGPSYREYITL